MHLTIILPESVEKQCVLFGINDAHLRKLRTAFDIKISVRNNRLFMDGKSESVSQAQVIIERLLEWISIGKESVSDELSAMLEIAEAKASECAFTEHGKVTARTKGQQTYLEALHHSNLVFAIGPAGTGKTYLAVAVAVEALRRGIVKRLVLTRPAVEAGERLGFLPGDLREKVNPYLRPIYDALSDMISQRSLVNYIESGVIEVAPLAFMRGRTLNRSFIILDEAQNTTPAQMKMFLTRMGEASRVVVTGDLTQVDISAESGLSHAVRILESLSCISVIRLTSQDVARHKLVQEIVNAYAKQNME